MKSLDGSWRRSAGVRLFALAALTVLVARAARAQVYQVIYDFANSSAADPRGPLIRASDGQFYGTTFVGTGDGSPGVGTVFRLDPKGSLTFLHTFEGVPDSYSDGAFPKQALLESSGFLFGSTSLKSTTGDCVASNTYRMDFVGNLSSIHCGLSTPAMSGLIEAFGAMCGTDDGGAGLYRMDSSGNAAILDTLDGRGGEGELLLASDGNVYGLAGEVLFRSDSQGNVTIMHVFSEGSGEPLGRLVEQGGFLWGTTHDGGDFGKGTMFRMDFAGNFATLHSFAGAPGDGEQPTGGLLVANNSSFYGTTQTGGEFGGGTLYQIDSFGNVVILHSFGDGDDGVAPGPLLAVKGALWGTTEGGGTTGAGTVYVLIPSSTSTVLRVTPTAGPVRVHPGDPVQIQGGVFPVGEVPTVKIGGLPASNVQLLDQENISAATPPDLSPGTLNEIIVVMPDGTQASLERAWMADFLDVPQNDRLHGFVERVFRAGLMDGCGGGNFCAGGTVDRAALVTMALKAKHGPAWAPPACAGVFKDVACPGPQADWVEEAVAEGIAQPCGRDKFCPDRKLTRDEIPGILLRTEHGASYVPPACGGIFRDVKCPSPNGDAIEQAYNEGLIEACSVNPLNYCPNRKVERGPMAEYASKAFRLP